MPVCAVRENVGDGLHEEREHVIGSAPSRDEGEGRRRKVLMPTRTPNGHLVQKGIQEPVGLPDGQSGTQRAAHDDTKSAACRLQIRWQHAALSLSSADAREALRLSSVALVVMHVLCI